ncbi:hypothetical protein BKA66DRAFT_444888 [Pyrenochaeta sp. MPI-SDFR-AT-0127]|nr:hypothetical protein BKA66DRAFT_444888 [Pyrenochaeta sp. MPI-SDFR-AT-0127]
MFPAAAAADDHHAVACCHIPTSVECCTTLEGFAAQGDTLHAVSGLSARIAHLHAASHRFPLVLWYRTDCDIASWKRVDLARNNVYPCQSDCLRTGMQPAQLFSLLLRPAAMLLGKSSRVKTSNGIALDHCDEFVVGAMPSSLGHRPAQFPLAISRDADGSDKPVVADRNESGLGQHDLGFQHVDLAHVVDTRCFLLASCRGSPLEHTALSPLLCPPDSVQCSSNLVFGLGLEHFIPSRSA